MGVESAVVLPYNRRRECSRGPRGLQLCLMGVAVSCPVFMFLALLGATLNSEDIQFTLRNT